MKAATLLKTGGRKYNEDYCSFIEEAGFGCYVLADGLGGHRGGAVAAKITVEAILEHFKTSPGNSRDHIKSYLETARFRFLEEQGKDRSLSNMKATLVVVLTDFREACWGHVGDSRLYCFRNGRLIMQTKDHSVPQHLADSGAISQEEVRFHEDRNRLTRAFDGGDLSRFEIVDKPLELQGNEAMLICSDGFWEYVLEPEMEDDLQSANTPALWLDLMEKRLLARVKSGNDNYSALALYIN
jgi:PPM family protein phosphatase